MKKVALSVLVIAVVLATVPFAYTTATGTIRIGPDVWPSMVSSPADFEIWVTGAGDPTTDPQILLVMTEDCWNGLTGNVVVSWSGGSTSFGAGDFTAVSDNSAHVPDAGTSEGARYTVASLKDHLSYGLSVPLSSTDTIYWAMGSILGGADLTTTPQDFTVILPSTAPRMLVYALGKSPGATVFDNYVRKVPPTRPGFVVPELGPVFAALASFSAFALYALKRRQSPK